MGVDALRLSWKGGRLKDKEETEAGEFMTFCSLKPVNYSDKSLLRKLVKFRADTRALLFTQAADTKVFKNSGS